MFPKYHPEGELSKDTITAINRRVKDIFTAKFSTVVMNSSDPIIISSFLGLTALAMYQNYYYIVHALATLLSVLLSSVMAGFGNSLLTETSEKNIRDLKKFTMIIMWLSSVFVVGIISCIQPVMDIWVGPDLKFSFGIVICFCIYYFTSATLRLFNMYKDAAGIWTYDKYRPMVAAGANLTLNLLTVRFLGIYGIILSTVVAQLVISIPWILRNLFKYVFDQKAFFSYVKRIIFYFVDAIIICVISLIVCNQIVLSPWLTFRVEF